MILSGNISNIERQNAMPMVLDREIHCIACGDKIEENSHACKCGHVHEAERKWIRGKRYSVYREELYYKLTMQELQQEHKRQSPKTKRKTTSDTQVHKISPKKRTRKSKHVKFPKRRKKQHGGKPRHAYGTPLSADAVRYENFRDNSKNFCSTRWNFEFALEDINRRFLKQSLFWIKL